MDGLTFADLSFSQILVNPLPQISTFTGFLQKTSQIVWTSLPGAISFASCCVSNLPFADFSSTPDFRRLYITKWERDLGVNFMDKQVERILLFSYKTSICAKHQESGWFRPGSVIHHWRSIGCSPNVPPTFVGGLERKTHLSCTFSGPAAFSIHFGRKVHRITQKCMNRKLPKDPVFFLLHHHRLLGKVYRQ